MEELGSYDVGKFDSEKHLDAMSHIPKADLAEVKDAAESAMDKMEA
jgi:hypothetical protein